MEFDEIVVKDSPGLCRCCLSEGCYKDLGSEYIWMGETEVYAGMLLDCFDIGISQHNEGPNGPNRLICEVCITRLRDACNFKKQVLESEKRFVDMVGKGEFRRKVIVYQDPIKAEFNPIQPDETEVEYLDDNLDLGDDNITELMETETAAADAITVTALPVKTKRGRPKKNVVKTESNITKVEEKPRTSKLVKGANLSTMEDKYKKKETIRKQLMKRRNVEYVLQYSNATPFLWYKGRYRCFFCVEPIKDPVVLREHTTEAHHTNDLELVIYDRTKNNRNKDAAVKIDVTNLSCNLCTQIIGTLDDLIHHLIIAHDAEYDVSVQNCFLPFKLDKEQPSCAICNMNFVSFEYLLRHSNKHHLSHDYMCDVCGTSFQGENHLKMHNRYYHREGGYKCEHCGVNMTTLSKKMLHEKNVHMINLSTCPQCPETFKSPYLKKLHLANVHGVEELKIKCPYCPKVYPQESIMSRHMRRVHLKEKNVECQICGDKFFGPYDVKLHMLKHNGDKKYVCSICGKKFSKKSNLNCHIITHSGKKEFVCPVCDKEFTYRCNMRMHLRTHGQFIIDDILNEDNAIELDFVKDLDGEETTKFDDLQ